MKFYCRFRDDALAITDSEDGARRLFTALCNKPPFRWDLEELSSEEANMLDAVVMKSRKKLFRIKSTPQGVPTKGALIFDFSACKLGAHMAEGPG